MPRIVPREHPLSSAWAKYNRALEHFQGLVPEGKELLAAGQPTLPIRFSCVVGDVIHNARVALDHAMWALVIAHAPNTVDAVDVFFPIKDDNDRFDKLRKKLLPQVGAEALAVLETLQPFHEERAALRWLRDLDNVDKHVNVLEIGPAESAYVGNADQPRKIILMTLRLDAVRSSPQLRVDFGLREVLYQTEECLFAIQQVFDERCDDDEFSDARS